MPYFSRPPCRLLQPFVQTLWVSEPSPSGLAGPVHEHVLPTGSMHLVFRLSDDPLRILQRSDSTSPHTLKQGIKHAVVGGVRTSFYVKDALSGGASVGAQLYPWAAAPLLGFPAHEWAERHTALEDAWGTQVHQWRERLLDGSTPQAQLDTLETALLARLDAVSLELPAVVRVRFSADEGLSMRMLAQQSGYSQKHFIALFRQAFGVTPKAYERLMRFQRALRGAASTQSWATLAQTLGFSDQAHLHREFKVFAGVTPDRYRHLHMDASHHVLL